MKIRIILSIIRKSLYWELIKRFPTKVRLSGKAHASRLNIVNEGSNNNIHCHSVQLLNCRISFKGSNNRLILGNNCYIPNTNFYFEGDNNLIEIGDNTYIDGYCEFCATEGSKIQIGEHCLLARNISMRTTDSHIITDMEGNRINPVQNIIIGKNVWIGLESLILKGSVLADDCIVGARSLVTSSSISKPFTIIAGSPAKIIKNNVKRQ